MIVIVCFLHPTTSICHTNQVLLHISACPKHSTLLEEMHTYIQLLGKVLKACLHYVVIVG